MPVEKNGNSWYWHLDGNFMTIPTHLLKTIEPTSVWQEVKARMLGDNKNCYHCLRPGTESITQKVYLDRAYRTVTMVGCRRCQRVSARIAKTASSPAVVLMTTEITVPAVEGGL
jgi:hypothetical protein